MEVTSTLKKLVSISSSYPHEKGIGEFIQKLLRRLHFDVVVQKVEENRFNILAQKGKGSALLLFGHLDTVAMTGVWKTHPFQLTSKGDRLYGFGAWDIKGGISAIVDAIKDFEPEGFTLKLAFVVDEENYSLGMHTLIQSGWLKNVFGAISPEPGFTYGLNGIALGRIGRSLYRVNVKTQGGHVYLVDKRHNAIDEAIKVLKVIQSLKKVWHKDLGEFIISPRFIHGGVQATSIPDSVDIELETQLVPPQTSTQILKELKLVFDKANINAQITVESVKRPTPFCEPFVIDVDNPFVKQVSKALQETISKKPTYYYRRSVADENRVAALGISVVTVGPAGGNAHEANEWVSKSSLGKLSQFLKRLLLTYNSK